ncbi:MAG TPA: hypothetical protein VGK72_09025 [Chthoniobacterales bacterium]
MSLPEDQPRLRRNLQIASFAIHAARGLVRDQTMRRKAMFWTVMVAVVMLFCGATFLAPLLDSRGHPGWFIFYWLLCAWVTITVVLLAIFDLLMVRGAARAQRRELGKKLAETDSPNDGD